MVNLKLHNPTLKFAIALAVAAVQLMTAKLFAVTSPASVSRIEGISPYASKFYTQVDIPITSPNTIRRVVYGNDTYGYFDTSDYNLSTSNLLVRLVPPGYRLPIKFYIERTIAPGNFVYAGSKSFVTPVPRQYQALTGEVSGGAFSSNYFIVTGSLPRGSYWHAHFKTTNQQAFVQSKFRFTFVLILNRLGEIVWLHVPLDGDELFQTYIQTKPIGRGLFGLILGKQAGFFQMVKFDGTITKSLRSRDVKRPFTMHHDFLVEDQSLIAISTRSAQTVTPKARKLGKTFLSDTLIRVDLNRNSSKKVFDFLPIFTPHTHDFWTGDEPSDQKFVLWNEAKVDFDFLHINALQKSSEGYLVGIRNLNKVVMIDQDLRSIKWTLGSDPRDTFLVAKPEDQFHHMHTPIRKENGNIVLFDNGFIEQSSRIIEYQLNYQKNTAAALWSYIPDDRLYSKDRGSIALLPNGNVLAYFVNPIESESRSQTSAPRDVMIEVNYENAKEQARMTRKFDTLSPGYRATPINEIGREVFLGFNAP